MDWNEELKLRTGRIFETTRPEEIEKRSFSVIRGELGEEFLSRYPKELLPVLLRVIHTTADFSYAQTLFFHAGTGRAAALGQDDEAQAKKVLSAALLALADGAPLVTDTAMAAAGVNKRAAAALGVSVHCLIGDGNVRALAEAEEITRSAAAVDEAARLFPGCIYVSGNAPTALMRLYERIGEGQFLPRLVIGVPVGFVNVVEAKELILSLPVPSIVARGRKGGSNVAAAICNALLYIAGGREL